MPIVNDSIKLQDSRTKVVATLGPATYSKAIVSKLIHEGVDLFRLNFSHSTREEHLRMINLIKELNLELETNVSILADLQGPKLRVGIMENNGIELAEGAIATFVTQESIGDIDHIYMSYGEFPMDVNLGDEILIDDGKIKLEVIETNRVDTVKARVIYGGPLFSNKGVNLPDTKVSLPCLTEEDISNALFVLEQGVDWIALSFVRKASDVRQLKDLIQKNKGDAGVIAKIEKPEALLEIDQIIDMADGIMVARGDLGVEVPYDRVPLIQKSIIDKCISQAKPVIVATQMMESMIVNSTPTRAEANDVANAVLDGADALMLSGETAIGKYPVETISSMHRIIRYTEDQGKPFDRDCPASEESDTFLADALCFQATKLAKQVKAKAIVVFTHSGYSAIRLSSHRPQSKIYTFTSSKKLLHKLSLVWGVMPFYLNAYNEINTAIPESIQILKDENLLTEGDCVVHVTTTPLRLHGRMNTVRVSYVE